MEGIIEFLFEIFFEVFGELFFSLVGVVFRRTNEKTKTRKRIKIIIYSVIGALCLVLLTFSLIYKKGIFIITTGIFLVSLVIVKYLLFIFYELRVNKVIIVITRIMKSIVRYAYSIILIVFANLYLVNKDAQTWLIVGSVFSIIIFIFVDAYRIYEYNTHKKRSQKISE